MKIALNYADHAKEMGSKADRAAPFWFFKPSTSYLPENSGPIILPKNSIVHYEGKISRNIPFIRPYKHYSLLYPLNKWKSDVECVCFHVFIDIVVELGVIIGKAARKVKANKALEHIAGYVCAIDVTARNWQSEAKASGRPWSLSKGCDSFLPMSTVIPADALRIEDDGSTDVQLYLDINDDRRQYGSTKDMVWKIPELIEHISEFVTLEEWDVILTGTPAGVGPIKDGDRIRAGIEGLVEMNFMAESE